MFAVEWSDYALDQLADVVVSLELAAQDQLTTAVEALNRRLGRGRWKKESRGRHPSG